MGKCIHQVNIEGKGNVFPVTLCGVNIEEKTGAGWTLEPEESTCHNCLKLRGEGQMGAPPPVKIAATEDEKIRWKYEDRVGVLERAENRLKVMKMEALSLIAGAMEGEDAGDLQAIYDWVDMAVGRLEMVQSQTGYVLTHMTDEKNEEGE